MFQSHVLLEILLASTLVGAQALVLTRLGIPFAAITLFAGLGGYAMAAGSVGGTLPVLAVIIAGVIWLGVFAGLRRPLPSDKYLLLTLAALVLTRAAVGAAPELGGQLGTRVVWGGAPTYDAAAYLPLALALFLVVVALLWVCEWSQLGFAIELARLSREDEQLRALVPVNRLAVVALAIAAVAAILVGVMKGLYSGRVSPQEFSLDLAITVLVATLVAGRRAWAVAATAVAFFAFPHVFSSLLGYQLDAMAHVREMLWSGLILCFGQRLISADFRPQLPSDRA